MPEDSKPGVTAALRAAILAGEYAPKQRLVEVDLCERFGTSRFVLRAALQELAAQGLVEFQRNRGARIRPRAARPDLRRSPPQEGATLAVLRNYPAGVVSNVLCPGPWSGDSDCDFLRAPIVIGEITG